MRSRATRNSAGDSWRTRRACASRPSTPSTPPSRARCPCSRASGGSPAWWTTRATCSTRRPCARSPCSSATTRTRTRSRTCSPTSTATRARPPALSPACSPGATSGSAGSGMAGSGARRSPRPSARSARASSRRRGSSSPRIACPCSSTCSATPRANCVVSAWTPACRTARGCATCRPPTRAAAARGRASSPSCSRRTATGARR